ncbi:hypothetical protein RUM43_014639 [Polyplax serrata]|uniref:CABIT domain-containing protein n=1 Tax=Polyplax serrata TaxID=468196 RepID=A0AAN8P154_POLSC
MAATDGQILVAAARWSDDGHYLRECVTKNRLPAVVKIIKGQYGGLGVPSLPCPGLQSTALLVSAGRRRKIVAQAVKLKEGRRVIGVGPRLAIPDTYEGFFEILSEEGRAVRCMESVSELARRRPEAGCLVREPVRAIVARYEDDGNITADGARTIAVGETLLLAGEATLGGAKGRYLRCLDSRGDTVLLGLEQRGRFSAIAKEDNISGVHTARNLLCKRLPMTVRLVHGSLPRGLKTPNHFVPELRLLSTFEEEHVFALPLQKEINSVIALPLAAPLKVQLTKNDDQLKGLKEFQRLIDKCGRLVGDVADRIQVLDGKLGDSKSSGRSSENSATPIKGGYFIRRSASSDSANPNFGTRSHCYTHRDENRLPGAPTDDYELDQIYDEIDQIYDYIRGFAPLPKSVRTPLAESQPSSTPSKELPNSSPPISPISTPGHLALLSTGDDKKPEPPPIETIPGKKMVSPGKAEKRTRRGSSAATKEPTVRDKSSKPLTKLYIKNNSHRGTHLLRQKSCSPVKDLSASPGQGKSGSPLFNIRYKSLSNLQQAMELSGTLDSSHSGGRTSGDSGPGAKLPEKRSRKISRPRSLTNLVWELRGGVLPVSAPEAMIIERKAIKPNRLEPGVHRKNSKQALGGSKRSETLYL